MKNPYYTGPPCANFDGTRFFNPGEPTTDRGLLQLLRWRLMGGGSRWPEHVPSKQAVPARREERPRITIVGHATALIQVAGINLLTDPVWSPRASPFRRTGPKRVTAPGVAFSDLPPIDTVLLSHNHYDHLDHVTLLELVARDDPLIVTPLGNDTIVRRRVPKARIASGNWGDRFRVGHEAHVFIVPANHWSARGLRDRRMALWGGFMLDTRWARIYFAGDTGYGTGEIFKAMRQGYGRPDVALIPIGAYAPRWFMAPQHCDPEEAVRIMLDLDARHAIGIHWGTFQLTDEPRDEPAERLAAALAARGIDPARFVAAEVGEVWDAPQPDSAGFADPLEARDPVHAREVVQAGDRGLARDPAQPGSPGISPGRAPRSGSR